MFVCRAKLFAVGHSAVISVEKHITVTNSLKDTLELTRTVITIQAETYVVASTVASSLGPASFLAGRRGSVLKLADRINADDEGGFSCTAFSKDSVRVRLARTGPGIALELLTRLALLLWPSLRVLCLGESSDNLLLTGFLESNTPRINKLRTISTTNKLQKSNSHQ